MKRTIISASLDYDITLHDLDIMQAEIDDFIRLLLNYNKDLKMLKKINRSYGSDIDYIVETISNVKRELTSISYTLGHMVDE